MSKLVYELDGVRGRHIQVYDRKCVIKTTVSIGSVITGNANDGEKTIFLKDVVGVQFKESGLTIGYLQFETPSVQMNNEKSNFFSENTFTFEENEEAGITNSLMREVYEYVVDRVEELKYGPASPHSQDISAIKATAAKQEAELAAQKAAEELREQQKRSAMENISFNPAEFIDELSKLSTANEMMSYVSEAATHCPELFAPEFLEKLKNTVFVGRMYGQQAATHNIIVDVKHYFKIE